MRSALISTTNNASLSCVQRMWRPGVRRTAAAAACATARARVGAAEAGQEGANHSAASGHVTPSSPLIGWPGAACQVSRGNVAILVTAATCVTCLLAGVTVARRLCRC